MPTLSATATIARHNRVRPHRGTQMTEDQHVWACALEVQREHGHLAPVFVAERIEALIMASDMAGVRHWRAIGACLAALDRPEATLE
jgi:hypothetical protein